MGLAAGEDALARPAAGATSSTCGPSAGWSTTPAPSRRGHRHGRGLWRARGPGRACGLHQRQDFFDAGERRRRRPHPDLDRATGTTGGRMGWAPRRTRWPSSAAPRRRPRTRTPSGALRLALGAPADSPGGRRNAGARSTSRSHCSTSTPSVASDPWGEADEGKASGRRQWAWKAARALEANDRAADTSMSRLAGLHGRAGGGLRARPSRAWWSSTRRGWTTDGRRGRVRAGFDGAGRASPIAVVDARTGRVLPADEEAPVNEEHRDAGRVLRFLVEDVPAVGLGAHRPGRGPGELGCPGRAGTRRAPRTDHAPRTGDLRSPSTSSARASARSWRHHTGRARRARTARSGSGRDVHDRYAAAGLFNHASSRLESSGAPRAARQPRERRACRPPPPGLHGLRRGPRLASTAVDGVRSVRTTLTLASGRRTTSTSRSGSPRTRPSPRRAATSRSRSRCATRRSGSTSRAGSSETGIPSIPGAATHVRAMRDWVALEEDGLALAWTTRDVPLVHVGGLPLPYAPFPDTARSRARDRSCSGIDNNVWEHELPGPAGLRPHVPVPGGGGAVRGRRHRDDPGPADGRRRERTRCSRSWRGRVPAGAGEASRSLLRGRGSLGGAGGRRPPGVRGRSWSGSNRSPTSP